MDFVGALAETQRQMAATRDVAGRRLALLHELAPRRGERLIEIGCGAGLALRDMALAVGPHGLAAGIDVSADQIAAAVRECAGVPAAQPQVGDALALPYPDGVFDGAAALQVVEYVAEAERLLAELARALKPGARFVCLATNWASDYWHGAPAELTAEVLDAWRSHAPWPNLPAVIGPMLARAGFGAVRQIPVPVVNAALSPADAGYWMARLVAGFAVAEGLDPGRAAEWLDALEAADRTGEFFFSSVPILTSAVRL